MGQHVFVEEVSVLKPPISTPCTTLFLHNLEQQLFFPVEMLFSYKVDSPGSTRNVAHVVRDALQQVLVPYYFVAGRIRVNEEQGRVELDCNGAGVLFASASCSSTIRDAGDLRMPNPSARNFLVFPTEMPTEICDVPLVTIQVTRFICGGFIVGILASHAIFDGTAGCEFYDAIARTARGDLNPATMTLNLDRSVFRSSNPPRPTLDHPELVSMPDVPAKLIFSPAHYHPSKSLLPGFSFKLFSFTPAMLDSLKKKALSDGTIARCSSFEALTAHIWQARAKASHDSHATTKVANLFVVVNVRHKVKNFPKDFVGNAVVAAPSCDTTVEDLCNATLSLCVRKVQAAIRRGTEEYVRSVMDWCEGRHGFIDLPGGMIITPWSKLAFHKLDFGWGNPDYVTSAVHDRKEYVVLLSNCMGDGGLDVFMGMEFEKMAKLEDFLTV
ncbi:BAHD family acyltransferase, clade V [Selaginella moellendorffii]|uniref:BAHD family acyltransferase, clade V n=1 Tax=Selaginella moellendorffii TaxID=88036 RepID=D8SZE7_SELML|nr:omega-hydroxypalmitate O-feruloyl transferase [Selaginella moellendorffii]EFJ10268.1 BAHD family acyltransferase, clade V [Selaginella moellendorffii]|eukprot:XP_002988757.1 omega-hydroxypalmitate O-feruloyl transferase [Selaginella moellendorffii]